MTVGAQSPSGRYVRMLDGFESIEAYWRRQRTLRRRLGHKRVVLAARIRRYFRRPFPRCVVRGHWRDDMGRWLSESATFASCRFWPACTRWRARRLTPRSSVRTLWSLTGEKLERLD